MNDWREVVVEQVTKLQESGLYNEAIKIRVGVVGIQDLPNFPEKFEIMFHNPCLKLAEIPTLNALHQRALKEDFIVLYMHTKGVSWKEQGYNRECMIAWRRYLEHFCIGHWKECVALLRECDASGCEYMEPRDAGSGILPSYFSGNFWWSKSSYLRKLPRVTDIEIPLKKPRRKAEYWLRSNPEFKAMSVFNLKKECRERGYLYSHVLDPRLYSVIGKSNEMQPILH